jgi:hypothetical protein
MKKFAFEQLPPEVAVLLEDIQHGRVLITRAGEPFAVVASVGNKDEEDLELEESPAFWRMIHERRREPATVRLEDFRAELEREAQSGAGADGDNTAQTLTKELAKDADHP